MNNGTDGAAAAGAAATGAAATDDSNAPGAAAASSYLTILPMNCVLNVVRPEINTVLGDSSAGAGGRVKLSTEARQCFLDCATELVMFLTQEASDRCDAENRRTLSGADIVTAVEALGFGPQYAAVARMALARATSDAPLTRPPPLPVIRPLPSQSHGNGDPPHVAPAAPAVAATAAAPVSEAPSTTSS